MMSYQNFLSTEGHHDPSNKFHIPSSRFIVKEEVRNAIIKGKPVVALESTIITHGMEYPMNRDTAVAVEDIVRENGAIPATIAIINGIVRIGLSHEEIEYLSKDGKVQSRKCSRRDLAFVLAQNGNGSTTVAATMYLANLAGIKIFVTGGIGGVHRGAETTFDISADLTELSRTPVSVICAGVKSILDIPKTLEFLETMGVPVVSYRSEWFPDFFTSNSGIKSVFKADSPEECAGIIYGNDILKLRNGIIFAVPVPKDKEANQENIQGAISQALKEADEKGVKGAAITPFLLKRVNELTGGESAASNVELIKNNAKLGAQIAVQYCVLQDQSKQVQSDKQQQSISRKITIIGGAALDIIAQSDSIQTDSGQSHIGAIRIQEGGSARNVAECVARLGLAGDLTFISAVGDDDKAEILKNSLKRVNVDLSGLYVKKGERTAAFSGMLNGKGDFLVGIADMDILANLPQSHLDLNGFQNSEILLVDSNISVETLTYILSQSGKISNVIYEPISKEKSKRILHSDLICHITMLKPNIIQLKDIAENLNSDFAGFSTDIKSYADCEKDIKAMINEIFAYSEKISGMNKVQNRFAHIVVTLGKHGVLVGTKSGEFTHHESLHLDEKLIKSAVGSGDNFMGGFIYGLSKGKQVAECVNYGQRCAIKSLTSERNVSEEIKEEILF